MKVYTFLILINSIFISGVFASGSISSLNPGRYDVLGSPTCNNGRPAIFKTAVAFENNYFVPMNQASKQSPPIFWILDYKGQRAIALGAVVQIDHWDCPDNGHSTLVHAHYSYLSLFKFLEVDFPTSRYQILGSYASNYYNTHTPYFADELEQDIDNEITFHMKPEIDGAIEQFKYYGPTKKPNFRIVDSLPEDRVRVEYENVCGPGQPALTVEYQRAKLDDQLK